MWFEFAIECKKLIVWWKVCMHRCISWWGWIWCQLASECSLAHIHLEGHQMFLWRIQSKKSKWETFPELVESEKVLEELNEFVKKSLFRKKQVMHDSITIQRHHHTIKLAPLVTFSISLLNSDQCLDRTTGKIYISRDVVFDEHHFPFAVGQNSNVSSQESHPVLFPQTELTIINDHMRNYDLFLLLANHSNAVTVTSPPVNASQLQPKTYCQMFHRSSPY